MPDPADGRGPLPPFRSWRPTAPIHPRHLRKIWLPVLIGVVIIGALVATVIVLTRPRPAEPVVVVPQKPDTTWFSSSVTVQSGEIMPTLLRRAGVGSDISERIVAALRLGGFNFRRMRPGDSLVMEYRNGVLARVLYRQSMERVYRVDLDADDCRVSMLLRSIAREPVLVRGGIETSLYEALVGLGEEPSLIADYADIFGWEIDFFCETQRDDSFWVLVERKMLDSAFVGYGDIIAARYRGAVGDFRAFRFTDPEGRTDYYNPEGESMRKTFLKSPLHFARITSFFGRRYHPIRRVRAEHAGIDYAAPSGTPVSCVANGNVASRGWSGGYGNLVEVVHPGGYRTRYGHLSRFGPGIRAGATVAQNQVVGYVGSTGLSTGPHLHYEVRRFDAPVNPLRIDAPRVEPVKQEYLSWFFAVRDSLNVFLEGSSAITPPLRQARTAR